jgi:TRAP-type C4-dicarboxylate transport system substrate-binding protein
MIGLVGAALPARADPVTLRMASAVPEGTAWAREGMAFARDVATLTHGEVRVKWYLGGIAGDELQVQERIRRDQLDGAGSGGILCTRLAPSMRVTRLVGLSGDRAESAYVLAKLKPTLDEEFRQSGFTDLWVAGLGPSIVFSREPVRSMSDLLRGRWWSWDLDELFNGGLRTLGLKLVPLPLHEAARAYDESRIDGFLTLPTAALAFQWSAQARYVTDLRLGFLSACLIVANRAFDPLPVEAQDAIKAASAKFQARMETVGREQDAALLGGLFAKQGLHPLPVSDELRRQLEAVARAAREHDAAVPAPLRKKVEGWLADYRADHPSR